MTKKVNPGDIDFISFIDSAIINQLGSKLDDFKYPNSEKKYGVDAYIIEEFPEGHQKRAVFVHDMAYWIDLFTKTRRIHGNRLSKGFLEVSF